MILFLIGKLLFSNNVITNIALFQFFLHNPSVLRSEKNTHSHNFIDIRKKFTQKTAAYAFDMNTLHVNQDINNNVNKKCFCGYLCEQMFSDGAHVNLNLSDSPFSNKKISQDQVSFCKVRPVVTTIRLDQEPYCAHAACQFVKFSFFHMFEYYTLQSRIIFLYSHDYACRGFK